MSCSRRASRRHKIRQRSSGIETASSSPFDNKLARVRESSLSVFARALPMPVSSGLTTITRSTNGSRIRATSQQLPVTSNATRSVSNRLSASSRSPSGVLGTRPAERTLPSSQIATTQKSRCTSRPIARPTHLVNANAIAPPPTVGWFDTRWENQRDNDTDRYELDRSIQARRRGGQPKSPGSKPIAKNGLPVCVLPKKAPVPDLRTVGPGPDGPSEKHFRAARSGAMDVKPERSRFRLSTACSGATRGGV